MPRHILNWLDKLFYFIFVPAVTWYKRLFLLYIHDIYPTSPSRALIIEISLSVLICCCSGRLHASDRWINLICFFHKLFIDAIVMRTTYQAGATEGRFILSPSNEGYVSAGACFSLLASLIIGKVWHVDTVAFVFCMREKKPTVILDWRGGRRK